MSDPARFIDIQKVTKRFGSVTAVDAVDLQIARGEFFSLLGASGCGKTTLLRMLAGFESPTEGEILIDGQPMAAVAAHRRPTNMVFQSYAIFPHLNVGQNIAYGLRKERLPKLELKKRVDEALEMIKLSGYASRRADQLSGGQRQRVALARALIRRPKVLLLDEPLGALDKKLREEMQLELRQLQESLGITFVFVTHDQEEALTMSDRIAVMSAGNVLQVDDPHSLYERPSCAQVAAFIGSMNFLKGKVRGRENGHAVVEAEGLGTIRAEAVAGEFGEGAPILLAIRPEKLAITDSAERAPLDNYVGAIEGKIAAASYLGDRSHYYVTLPGVQRPLAVAAQNVDRETEGWLQSGAPVWLSWQPKGPILLPAE
ncbi:spermidine/putrescine transport system ATP-binding protein/putrescine transport system ATP-binding protein [Tistlia consotensis]|uniref:Spermidine/putrescine import ATP-binding protein PotA n=1 Tax=Tistlia consotensis USBA 355 TaxID=560819 RepID=A0A1Y6BR16_9PROT|nr:ABC transporter ATP-binding protein [Tistlia consotensis]SMF13755.1 spermidine/putrescine transport system ATP-binding protein/putrescine transport system ATP-binding protein [Tistlia consotensis USBA 355]SNR50228.1 spermidine/putrescine transport system ATP-binding protein/putrescine transport system ATP-binding protein [Tistlia consotensis]